MLREGGTQRAKVSNMTAALNVENGPSLVPGSSLSVKLAAAGLGRGTVCSFQVVMSLMTNYVSDMYVPSQHGT